MPETIDPKLRDELKKRKSEFVLDFRAETTWRKDKREYGKFYDGDQLSKEELQSLEERGQPPVVINRIKPKCDAIFGIQQALRVDTKVYAAGDKENEALILSEVLRNVEDQSSLDAEESKVFEDQVIDGRGWYKATKVWDGLEARDIVEKIDNDDVVLDRYCKRSDLKDAKRVHETIWMDLEDAKEMFPGSKQALEDAVNNPEMAAPIIGDKLSEYNPDQYKEPGDAKDDSQYYDEFVDKKKKRVRIVTSYYRATSIERFLTHKGGTVDVSGMSDSERKKALDETGGMEWTQTRHQLNTVTFTWNAILEARKDIRAYDREGKFPFFLAAAYVTRDEKRTPYGLVKQMMDPQQEVNKRRSKNLHMINTNQTWFEDGAFENETKARMEIARPDGWVKYRKEFKVDNVKHTELAQAQFQLLQESKAEIDSVGVGREIEGKSPASSGKEFQLRQQQAMQPIRKLFVNLRETRRLVALYLIEEILNRYPDLATQVNRYDVVIDEAPDTINLQGETFDTLVSLAKGGVPIPPDTLIEASPLANKKDLLEKMNREQQMQQMIEQLQQQLEQAMKAAGAAPPPK